MEKETKHTPEFEIGPTFDEEFGRVSCIVYKHSGPHRILFAHTYGMDSETARRNAELIASAPTLKAENTRLKSELLHRDVTVLPQKDLEYEEMKKEREELIQGKDQVISMCRDLIEICERHLPMAGAPSDWMTVRETIEAIKK